MQQSEPIREAAAAKFAATASGGKTYQAEFYNLDGIISVGYRGKTNRGTQFRIWATGILKESMRKEFVPDDERLKNRYKGSDLPEDSTCANFAQVADNRKIAPY